MREPQAHYLYDRINYDSNIERNVALKDPRQVDDKTIVVFAKLPRISIPTPYKSYSPDFAYYIQTEAGKKLFLVVETKGYDSIEDIPADERRKTQYGKRFFEALNRAEPDAQVVFKQRINREELAQLLQSIGEGK